ncbi:MAG: hypothetical protein HYT19_00335 [Candidatus Nealsonbacteria bacterium]|nr:hypothetical protein [Candidatus Nealsonbacteria bacterium]
MTVINFITLYIQYVSFLFPDPLNFFYTSIAGAVRISTSILVVALPVYILTSWLLGKDLKKNTERREFKLRKWLLYFILFVAAITIIVDLIMLVNSFLSGELTVRFLLKVLVVLLTALAVFEYYIWDLRRKDPETSKTPKKLAFGISFVVLASVILGFFIIGTPAEQRRIRFDDQRIGDLQTIQGQIINFWIKKESLPIVLDDLNDSISGFVTPADPETKSSYEYNITGLLSFELCATFKTSGKDSTYKIRPLYPAAYPGDSFQQNWNHEAGRVCFARTIDPVLYKQVPVK